MNWLSTGTHWNRALQDSSRNGNPAVQTTCGNWCRGSWVHSCRCYPQVSQDNFRRSPGMQLPPRKSNSFSREARRQSASRTDQVVLGAGNFLLCSLCGLASSRAASKFRLPIDLSVPQQELPLASGLKSDSASAGSRPWSNLPLLLFRMVLLRNPRWSLHKGLQC